jgi:hypothetical protein
MTLVMNRRPARPQTGSCGGGGAYGLEAELEEAGAEGEEAILHLAVRKPLVGPVALAPAQAVTIGVQREAAPNDKPKPPTLGQSTRHPHCW